MKTATKIRSTVTIKAHRKGGDMVQTHRSLKEIESDIRALEVEIFEANIDRYRRYGALLNEARPQMTPVKFWAWAERVSGRGRKQLLRYMDLQRTDKSAKTLDEAIGRNQAGYHTNRDNRIRDEQWDEIFNRAKKVMDAESRKIVDELEEDSGEEKRRADVAERIVTTGYKVLASTMHPDKGGSQAGMVRLNLAKQTLLEFIEEMRG